MEAQLGGSVGSPSRPAVEVYGDESLGRAGQDLVGMIHLSAPAAVQLRQEIEELRTAHGFLARRGEFKWVKASGRSPLPVYIALVNLVCGHIAQGRLHFRCVAVPDHLHGKVLRNAVGRDLGFYNAWQVLLQPFLAEGHVVRVYLDRRNDRERESLVDLKEELNLFGRVCLGRDGDCCEVIEARDSHGEDLIQVVDLLLGAVGFHLAGGHLRLDASPAKIELAQQIAKGIGAQSLLLGPDSFKVDLWTRK